MQLLPNQINQLLDIINKNQAILIGSQLGTEFLSEYDKALLEINGVDWKSLYDSSFDSIYTSFHLGMLAQALGDVAAMNKLDYNTVKEYIQRGQYIPVTAREQAVINAVKSQSYSDIKAMTGRIFQDIHGILNNQSVESQREFLRKEIEEGVRDKKTIRQIANSIAEKTGDWGRNFDRIVDFQANSAYQEGRAAIMERDGGSETLVYKRVFASACKHCIGLYLTNGFGSEPILFKLSDLRANGTNIGRKVDDWRPTVGSTHPHCRCLLMHYPKGYKWNPKTQSFDIAPEKPVEIQGRTRPKVRVWIGGKELML